MRLVFLTLLLVLAAVDAGFARRMKREISEETSDQQPNNENGEIEEQEKPFTALKEAGDEKVDEEGEEEEEQEDQQQEQQQEQQEQQEQEQQQQEAKVSGQILSTDKEKEASTRATVEKKEGKRKLASTRNRWFKKGGKKQEEKKKNKLRGIKDLLSKTGRNIKRVANKGIAETKIVAKKVKEMRKKKPADTRKQ